MAADTYEKYTAEAVNGIYDAKRDKQLRELEERYRQSVSAAEISRGRLGAIYQQKQNDTAADFERSRRSMNEVLASKGAGSGFASQAALAQRNAYLRNSGALHAAEAEEFANAEYEINALGERYRSDVGAAIAANDYERAEALYQSYKDNYNRRLSEAGTLAKYGDFSGYNDIYGDESAEYMQRAWNASNPELAYNIGAIDAEEYRRITGKYPKGAAPAASGGTASGKKKTAVEVTPAYVAKLFNGGKTPAQIVNTVAKNGGSAADMTNAAKWASQMTTNVSRDYANK